MNVARLVAQSAARRNVDAKVGRERLWEFEPTHLEEARRSLDVIAQQWDHALSKLKMAVER